MGTTFSVMPMQIIGVQPNKSYAELSSQNNLGFHQGYHNAMALPPGNEDGVQYEHMGYRCEGGATVCKATNQVDENGDPINWQIVDTRLCNERNQRLPGIMDVPKCGNQSRGILPQATDDKQTKTLKYAVLGVGVVAVIALGAWALKKYAK